MLSWEGRAELGGLAGPLLVAGATLCWAIDNNLTQKVSAADPVQIATLKGLVAARRGAVWQAIAASPAAGYGARRGALPLQEAPLTGRQLTYVQTNLAARP